MAVENFNKIINIDFLTEAGQIDPTASIKTPNKGRKPNIEIVGQLVPHDETLAITVTIKNLYMDLTKNKYQRVRVTAGYEEGTKISMDGTITYMFQASPGPESEVVIQLMPYVYRPWTEKIIELNYEGGYTLATLLQDVSQKIGYNTPLIQAGLNASLNVPFVYSGAAKDVVAKIRTHFASLYPNLVVKPMDTKIKAYILGNDPTSKLYKINYLKSPPQLVGGGDTGVSATITAPWQPEIRPGDRVIVNTGFYSTSNFLKNTAQEMTIAVNTIDFQFGTVGSANQMVIMGVRTDV